MTNEQLSMFLFGLTVGLFLMGAVWAASKMPKKHVPQKGEIDRIWGEQTVVGTSFKIDGVDSGRWSSSKLPSDYTQFLFLQLNTLTESAHEYFKRKMNEAQSDELKSIIADGRTTLDTWTDSFVRCVHATENAVKRESKMFPAKTIVKDDGAIVYEVPYDLKAVQIHQFAEDMILKFNIASLQKTVFKQMIFELADVVNSFMLTKEGVTQYTIARAFDIVKEIGIRFNFKFQMTMSRNVEVDALAEGCIRVEDIVLRALPLDKPVAPQETLITNDAS